MLFLMQTESLVSAQANSLIPGSIRQWVLPVNQSVTGGRYFRGPSIRLIKERTTAR
jgi:hypothetical protein